MSPVLEKLVEIKHRLIMLWEKQAKNNQNLRKKVLNELTTRIKGATEENNHRLTGSKKLYQSSTPARSLKLLMMTETE